MLPWPPLKVWVTTVPKIYAQRAALSHHPLPFLSPLDVGWNVVICCRMQPVLTLSGENWPPRLYYNLKEGAFRSRFGSIVDAAPLCSRASAGPQGWWA